ncbi:hypothetical protein BDA96_04G102300 [Sorghum bicolor]|uniref:Uncharacterized protein n=2 Tax=Sorghum bicolor TaxID=4558 RepID=A0A921R2Y1_SORBI|nr:hypothetical protein BDA96_04G102300 [Sorghum bicolor]OQU84647.1 hypothetical protein SORBI_3004G094150 [Sorghum bicolor]
MAHSEISWISRLCILCVISGRRWIQCLKDNLCNLAEISDDSELWNHA